MRPSTSVVSTLSASESSASQAAQRDCAARAACACRGAISTPVTMTAGRPSSVVRAKLSSSRCSRPRGVRLQFDLEPRRRGLARGVAAQVFGDEFGIVGMHEVRRAGGRRACPDSRRRRVRRSVRWRAGCRRARPASPRASFRAGAGRRSRARRAPCSRPAAARSGGRRLRRSRRHCLRPRAA